VTPLRIGPRERELVAILHPRSAARERRAAALLCPPLGQESVRTHRLMRVLAERLAREGFDVLRFDYFGTGDSPGDDVDADLDGWRIDVARAAEALLQASGPVPTTWIGLRLGATVAMQAVADVTHRPAAVVACDPVLDGARYLKALAADHIATQAASYSLAAWRPPAAPSTDGALDAVGFALSGTLQAQLGGLRWVRTRGPAQTRIVLTGGCTDLDKASVQTTLGATSCVALAEPFDWTSEEALNASLVPGELLAALFAQVLAP